MPPRPKDSRGGGSGRKGRFSEVGEEARQHFNFFYRPGMKGERAQCHHCDEETRFAGNVSALLEHIANCADPSGALKDHPFRTRKGHCTFCKTQMPYSELKAHRHKCPKMPQPCGCCGQHVLREVYHAHGQECKKHFFRCPRCFKKGMPVAERDAHLEVCQMVRCPQCHQHFPVEDKETHPSVCDKFYCYACRKTMLRTEKDEHILNCEMFECSMCRKLALKADREHHKSEECGWRMCTKCRGSFPRDEYESHFESCPFGPHQCTGCNKTGMTREEKDIHKESCEYIRCNACHKTRIPLSEYVEHRKTCQWRWCCRCKKTMLVENVEVHLTECFACYFCRDPNALRTREHICPIVVCRSCAKHIPRDQMSKNQKECVLPVCPFCSASFTAAKIPAHKRLCATNFFQGQLVSTTPGQNKERPKARQINLGIWGAPMNSTSRLSKDNHFTRFPRSVFVDRVEDSWRNEPFTTVIADFEFNPKTVNAIGSYAIYEIALANARGEWIIPPTTINHQLSLNALADLLMTVKPSASDRYILSRFRDERDYWMAYLGRFYDRNSDETKGCTWEEIAAMIDRYVQEHGKLKVFLDRSATKLDYECFSLGLQSAGRPDLLPPQPSWPDRPMAWWRSANRASQSNVSLRLGEVFSFYFPGDKRVKNWHYAGVDVQMTIALIEKYFALSRGEPHYDLGENGIDISNDDGGADLEDASEEESWGGNV